MPDCLLKPIKNAPNQFTAVAGELTLSLTDVVGQTQINTMDTSIVDLTDPAAPLAVTPDKLEATSLSLRLVSGKKYFISFTFIQIVAQFTAKADLREGCGNLIGTIGFMGLYPGYFVEVA